MTRRATKPSTEIIDQGAPNTVLADPATVDQLMNELAAVCGKIIAKRNEKRDFDGEINGELKKLEERMGEIVDELRAGGVQLGLNWGTKRPNAAGDENANDTEEAEAEE